MWTTPVTRTAGLSCAVIQFPSQRGCWGGVQNFGNLWGQGATGCREMGNLCFKDVIIRNTDNLLFKVFGPVKQVEVHPETHQCSAQEGKGWPASRAAMFSQIFLNQTQHKPSKWPKKQRADEAHPSVTSGWVVSSQKEYSLSTFH